MNAGMQTTPTGTDARRVEPISSERREIERLRRQVEHLSSRDCRACGGLGITDGFWLGAIKKCPACDGRGVRG